MVQAIADDAIHAAARMLCAISPSYRRVRQRLAMIEAYRPGA